MADYRVIVRQSAISELGNIDKKTLRAIVKSIGALAKKPIAPASAKFSARDFYRLRTGGYRVSYHLDEAQKTVDVFKVGARSRCCGI
jgi:mRNA interferase RelE/StbE